MLSEKGRKPLIVPIFIPNAGCPDRCVFCEQEKITSQSRQELTERIVFDTVHTAIRSRKFDPRRDPEIAFFGGTFTRLPDSRMKELLDAACSFLKNGLFGSIRVSTRPDALKEHGLETMKAFGVRTVELGAQSLDDEVLSLSRRGHTAEDTIEASRLLREHGFRVGIQLMPGLPGDSEERFRATVNKVLAISPDMVRLYPAVVIRGTVMAKWYEAGRYRPLDLEEALRICAEACVRLEERGIPVIRIGLMSSPSLMKEGQIVAGPWHPAFGLLVRSRIHLERIQSSLPQYGSAPVLRIRAPEREISLLRGYKNSGLRHIQKKTGAHMVEAISDETVPAGEVRVERVLEAIG